MIFGHGQRAGIRLDAIAGGVTTPERVRAGKPWKSYGMAPSRSLLLRRCHVEVSEMGTGFGRAGGRPRYRLFRPGLARAAFRSTFGQGSTGHTSRVGCVSGESKKAEKRRRSCSTGDRPRILKDKNLLTEVVSQIEDLSATHSVVSPNGRETTVIVCIQLVYDVRPRISPAASRSGADEPRSPHESTTAYEFE
jgi:hypothetical protein